MPHALDVNEIVSHNSKLDGPVETMLLYMSSLWVSTQGLCQHRVSTRTWAISFQSQGLNWVFTFGSLQRVFIHALHIIGPKGQVVATCTGSPAQLCSSWGDLRTEITTNCPHIWFFSGSSLVLHWVFTSGSSRLGLHQYQQLHIVPSQQNMPLHEHIEEESCIAICFQAHLSWFYDKSYSVSGGPMGHPFG